MKSRNLNDDLNAIAWHDFLLWAWSEPQMRAQFTAKTGVEIQDVTAPINAAIDAATGASQSKAAQFIEWATREHWGLESAPRAYQEAISTKKLAR
jgi:hypothetical protein